jgi:hypothetical protein
MALPLPEVMETLEGFNTTTNEVLYEDNMEDNTIPDIQVWFFQRNTDPKNIHLEDNSEE